MEIKVTIIWTCPDCGREGNKTEVEMFNPPSFMKCNCGKYHYSSIVFKKNSIERLFIKGEGFRMSGNMVEWSRPKTLN